MYQGSYHGSKKHESDLQVVLNRAWTGGLDKMIVTGGSLTDSKKAIEMSRSDGKPQHPTKLQLLIHRKELCTFIIKIII